jgi:hypothetical protein
LSNVCRIHHRAPAAADANCAAVKSLTRSDRERLESSWLKLHIDVDDIGGMPSKPQIIGRAAVS